MDFKGSWCKFLPLAECAYNNSYQATIGMAPYEALYGRRYRSLICWHETGEKKSIELELKKIINFKEKTYFVNKTSEVVKVIQQRIATAQSGKRVMQMFVEGPWSLRLEMWCLSRSPQ